jgi:hypothetical protein
MHRRDLSHSVVSSVHRGCGFLDCHCNRYEFNCVPRSRYAAYSYQGSGGTSSLYLQGIRIVQRSESKPRYDSRPFFFFLSRPLSGLKTTPSPLNPRAEIRVRVQIRVQVASWLPVYRQWVRLGPKSLGAYDQRDVVLSLMKFEDQNQSQSHITSGGQSASMSWCRAPSGTHDQTLFPVGQLLSCPCGAPSLTRGWVCHLSVTFSSNMSIGRISVYFHFTCHDVYTRPLSVQAQHSRSCAIICILRYYSSGRSYAWPPQSLRLLYFKSEDGRKWHEYGEGEGGNGALGEPIGERRRVWYCDGCIPGAKWKGETVYQNG